MERERNTEKGKRKGGGRGGGWAGEECDLFSNWRPSDVLQEYQLWQLRSHRKKDQGLPIPEAAVDVLLKCDSDNLCSPQCSLCSKSSLLWRAVMRRRIGEVLFVVGSNKAFPQKPHLRRKIKRPGSHVHSKRHPSWCRKHCHTVCQKGKST